MLGLARSSVLTRTYGFSMITVTFVQGKNRAPNKNGVEKGEERLVKMKYETDIPIWLPSLVHVMLL